MPDMLARLYTLPDHHELLAQLHADGITIRRVIPPEKHLVVEWVRNTFSENWATEVERAILNTPITCIIAVHDGALLGFACYDATFLGYFGPTGVLESERGKGIGKALLLATLHAMHEHGYGYAIIGWVGPAEFYTKCCSAELIADSTPGNYVGMLTRQPAAT